MKTKYENLKKKPTKAAVQLLTWGTSKTDEENLCSGRKGRFEWREE